MLTKVGCTGWSYDGWLGTFYPATSDKSNWLKYYSSVFDFTEINSTFYKIPTQIMTKKWEYDTPSDFRFSAKFPGIITHDQQLGDVQDYVKQFLEAMAPLGKKLLALVLQLPPSLSFHDAHSRLDRMLKYLPENILYPIEGRHKSWFAKDALSYMKKKNLCLVWNELPDVDNPAPTTSNMIYLRLIGDRSIPEEKFGKKVRDQSDIIAKWTEKIEEAEEEGDADMMLLLANNHLEGFAPATANSLRASIGMPEVKWEEKYQHTLGEFESSTWGT